MKEVADFLWIMQTMVFSICLMTVIIYGSSILIACIWKEFHKCYGK